jgi:hypothetical protein
MWFVDLNFFLKTLSTFVLLLKMWMSFLWMMSNMDEIEKP